MKKSGVLLILNILFLGIANGLFAQNQLTGVVNYYDDDTRPISQVTLGLYDLQDELVVSAVTDDNGQYFFNSVPGGEYYVKASANHEPDLVDIQDSYLVLMYLLGRYEFDELQFQAADVDNSGTVTWDDYYFISVNYLLFDEPFPAGVWQFEEAYVDFTSREEPDSSLWGISKGDVDGYWEPSGRGLSIPDYSHYPVQVNGNEILLEVNSNYNDQITGFNINLAYPANQIDIIDITGPDGNLNYVLDEEKGFIKVIWMDENNTGRISGDKLITLTVETKSEDIESSEFELLPGSMLIDAKGGEIKDVEIQLPTLEKNTDIELNVTTYPNPVVDVLNVRLSLNETNYASISFFDMNGKLVSKTANISLEKGEQSITVDTQRFKPGNYIYVVELLGNTKFSTTGQIVKSR